MVLFVNCNINKDDFSLNALPDAIEKGSAESKSRNLKIWGRIKANLSGIPVNVQVLELPGNYGKANLCYSRIEKVTLLPIQPMKGIPDQRVLLPNRRTDSSPSWFSIPNPPKWAIEIVLSTMLYWWCLMMILNIERPVSLPTDGIWMYLGISLHRKCPIYFVEECTR